MNLHQFDENLWRGQRPPSVKWLRDNGFKRVVNLQWGWMDVFKTDDYELERKSQPNSRDPLILEYHFSDFTAPSEDQLRHIAETINSFNLLGLKTLVHCKFGVDRTGMAVAAYKKSVLGQSYDVVVKDMYAHGFHKWPYRFWVPQLKKI